MRFLKKHSETKLVSFLLLSYCFILLYIYHKLLPADGRKKLIIGMINMEDEKNWTSEGSQQIIHVAFEKISPMLKWGDLIKHPPCPEIPMPCFEDYGEMDMIVVKSICRNKNVSQLQLNLVAANLAVKNGRWDKEGRIKMVFLGECPPMVEIFRCNDLVKEEGEKRVYRPEKWRLEQITDLPVGPCGIMSMPSSWSKETKGSSSGRREAYATVLHSSEDYVCGAIILAQTLIRTGTKKDLVLLHDDSISAARLTALSQAGWKLRSITRIRYPKAKRTAYNGYNYSKLRLWELIEYDKIVYIDADIVVLQNLDALFNFPQISATMDHGFTDFFVFNSGVMVVEPSECTFQLMMSQVNVIRPYNGGDQGFLNSFMTWWHRLPSEVNVLSIFWSNSKLGENFRNNLLEEDPSFGSIHYQDDKVVLDSKKAVYSIHYSGWKPWWCYRDYDCNWDDPFWRSYAKDEAFSWWWQHVYDVKGFCGLSKERMLKLEKTREKARYYLGHGDSHWKINITDPRKFNLLT